MRWPALIFAALLASTVSTHGAAITTQRRVELREETRQLWTHAYSAYIENAFPADELKPLSCTAAHRDTVNKDNAINDVLGK